MNRTGRGVLGNKPASGTEIIQELGEEHQRTGKWIVYTSADSVFQIAAHEETVPLEELYDACRVAREILTGKHAVGRVIARPFIGVPGAYERTPNRHDFSLEPRRPNYLSIVREAGHKVYGVGKIGDIFAHQDVDEEFPTRSNVEGIQKTEELLRTIDDGLVFTNLVETDSLWGHRNDPVNFHRCLQDFDRRLPDILDALRPNDLLILTSDHGCDPTTPSTDHSREHALLLAYVEGRNAAGRIHEDGEFADVGRDGQRLARRHDGTARHSGPRDPRAVRALNEPALVRERVRRRAAICARAQGDLRRAPKGRTLGSWRSRPSPRSSRAGCWRSEAARASWRERFVVELGVELCSLDQSERMVELARARGLDAAVGDVQSLPFADDVFDCAVAAWMLYHATDVPLALAELARVLRPGGRLVAVTNAAGHLAELRALAGESGWWAGMPFSRENGPELLAASFSTVEARHADGWVSIADDEAIWAYLRSMAPFALPDELPPHELPLRVQRKPTVFVATK